LTIRGFWLASWYEEHGPAGKQQILNEVAKMIRDKKLTYFFEEFDLDDFQTALHRNNEAFHLRKVVLRMDYPDRMKEHDAMDPKKYSVFETSLV
jgi:hypothetical protein